MSFGANVLKAAGLGVLVSGVMLTGCGGGGGSSINKLEGVVRPAPAPAPAAETTTFSVRLIDQDGSPIPSGLNSRLTIRNQSGVTGDAERFSLVTSDTPPVTPTFNIDTDGVGGVLSLDVGDAPLVADDPINVVFVASATGFISSSSAQNITVSDAYAVTIQLASNSPDDDDNVPVASASPAPVATTNGTTTAETISASPATKPAGETQVTGSTSVRIPSGTGLRTASGGSPTGAVQLRVTYFDSDAGADEAVSAPSDGALTLFPGGLDAPVVEGGVTAEGVFSTIGFTAVELVDENNEQITEFTGELIEITINIPPNLPFPANPLVGSDVDGSGTVTAGDLVPVWTYDEILGRWTRHTDTDGNVVAAPVLNEGGNLLARFTTDHLSYYTMAFRFSFCASGDVNFSVEDVNGNPYTGKFTIGLNQFGGGWARSIAPAGSKVDFSTIALNRLPRFPIRLGLFADADKRSDILSVLNADGSQFEGFEVNANNRIVATTPNPRNLCSLDGAVIRLNVSNAVVPEPQAVSFTVVNNCSNPTEAQQSTIASLDPYVAVYNNNFFDSVSFGSSNVGSLSLLPAGYEFVAASQGESTQPQAFSVVNGQTTAPITVTVGERVCPAAPEPDPEPTGGTGGTGSVGTGG